MKNEGQFHDTPGVPILLREARGAFASRIRAAFAASGLPELPNE